MSRQLKEIDWKLVEKLIDAGCSGIEIAGKLRVKDDTFYRRFEREYKCRFGDYRGKSAEGGLADLRLMIHAKALNNRAPGNSNLLIFLARCRLGMKEPESTTNLSPNQNQIDQSHEIMRLQHELDTLRANGNKPKAE